ncbi:EAL domain-containing protein [Sphingomonas sp.]|jgi:EAL domain-containing protein (putative c-di-GMP-specific phosphodiesterase class I)|uniref:EAL domain-containing protein n=1 Tax=Sphingomonas sp. TaxID=28214 RepID=UPI002E30BECA|nr:EAL domain-containing protein [Sphingomonas sp.]HEX4693404.1 EAL domain-containing protein [Sphingomonas sp.]
MAPARTPTKAAGKAENRRGRAALTAANREPTDTSAAAPWLAQALLQISNQGTLRRLLGVARTNDLVLDVADRIVAVLPDATVAVVGRWTVEVDSCVSDAAELAAFASTLAAAIADPFDLDGEQHAIELAIGVAAGPPCAIDDVRLAEEVEDALAQSRNEQVPVVRDLSQVDPMTDALALRRDLPGAIDRGEMFLQYQPKVHVRRQEVASAEALVRWRHPTRGLILPGDFIPLAESSREIDRLTLWTIEQVIADQALLRRDGQNITIFINISGQLLSNAKFVKRACEIVTSTDVSLGFEITETSVIRDPGSAIANLNVFADHGIEIAIDDYGAGLSSLAYLKQLPARELKIDKMFVLQLTSSNRDPLIVRSTIDLAHALEMEVTAEGVETPAALALLSVMGCDMIQGYLISRPLEIDAFRHYMRDHKDAALVDTARATFRAGALRRVG